MSEELKAAEFLEALRLEDDDLGGDGSDSGFESAVVALSGKLSSAREPRILSAARS